MLKKLCSSIPLDRPLRVSTIGQKLEKADRRLKIDITQDLFASLLLKKPPSPYMKPLPLSLPVSSLSFSLVMSHYRKNLNYRPRNYEYG